MVTKMKKILVGSFLISIMSFANAGTAGDGLVQKDSDFDYNKKYSGYMLKGNYFHEDVIGAVKVFDRSKGETVDYDLLIQSVLDKAKVRTKTYNGETVVVISHY